MDKLISTCCEGTVGALEGAGGKGGRTGVNDGPQTTTNTGIKDKRGLI